MRQSWSEEGSQDRAEDVSRDRAEQVRDFYEREGWVETDGRLGEARLFGPRDDAIGLTRDQARERWIRELLAVTTQNKLIEFGGGGQPAAWLMDDFSSYTGVDFSKRGLEVAAQIMQRRQIRAEFVEADVRALPLPDSAFDAGFSAHMIYHLPTQSDQLAALGEMARVIRSGGVLALVAANPYPWLFPGRVLRRLVVNAPGLGPAVERVRPSPPLPYLPLSARWMADVLARWGTTQILPFDMASVWFGQHVSDRRRVGRFAWGALNHIESAWPRVAVGAGCYVLVVLRKGPERR
jgi:ubiquinone/menaquinone biosynthesis C-methylase UbiE